MMKDVDPRLAPEWPASRVLACIESGEKAQIVEFLKSRYKARFFTPVNLLLKTPRTHPGSSYDFGYGFAIMALCSLLIETIQSYWDGLPSNNIRRLRALKKENVPTECAIPAESEWTKGSREAFKKFFSNPLFADLFPDVNPDDFYQNIRCGLLHQAQTEGGWRLLKEGSLWDKAKRTLNRDEFARVVESAFDRYIDRLSEEDWDSEMWRKARRKIWWLVKVSK